MEVGLTSLWLPIVLSAILVFIASSLVYMVLQWHNSDWSKLWHFPAYSFGVLFLTGFTIAMAIIATWMYNHSKGSLFPIALLHANGNATFQFVDKAFPSLDNETGFALIAFLLWVVIAVMLAWRSKMLRIDDPPERRGTA